MNDSTAASPARPVARPKVPAFARYEGTSCWRKDRRKVREYNRFRAQQAAKAAQPAA